MSARCFFLLCLALLMYIVSLILSIGVCLLLLETCSVGLSFCILLHVLVCVLFICSFFPF